MKAAFISVLALTGIAAAANKAAPLAPRQTDTTSGSLDGTEADKVNGQATECRKYPGDGPTVSDCRPVIQWYEDHRDGTVEDLPQPGESKNIYCLGDCTIQVTRNGDVDLKNGQVADAANKITDGCGGGDGKTDGVIVEGEGDAKFFLALLPRMGDDCKWD